MQKMKFDQIKNDLKTGDIFLAHGDTTIAEFIEIFTDSEYSHSGMVVLAKDIGLEDCGADVLLWESTRDTHLKDIITKKNKADQKYVGGTFLVSLRERMEMDLEKKTDAPFFIRKLNYDRPPEMYSTLKSIIHDKCNAFFPGDILFAKEYIEGKDLNILANTDKDFFCSKLLAFNYQNFGLLDMKKVCNGYSPESFGSKHMNKLLKGAFLDSEIEVEI